MREEWTTILNDYVDQATTHGIRKIHSSRGVGRRTFWTVVFLLSLAGLCYHCTHLIRTYAAEPKVTVTQEKDADFVEFPALTVCNLNVVKKGYAEKYFTRIRKGNGTLGEVNSTCPQSEEELLRDSAIDLSDTWMNLGVTNENLSNYGHKAKDMIVQCTYNNIGCSSNKSIVRVSNVTRVSPIFGLCHSFYTRDKSGSPAVVKRGGTIYGLRVTLNIERDEYWDLTTPEYGVRLLVHPQSTYPTLQRGGIIGSPGRSIHMGVRRKVTTLLPGHEQSCAESFEKSKIISFLKDYNLDYDVKRINYTYEYCNTLCLNLLLYQNCQCIEEAPNRKGQNDEWRFCNPCNKTQAKCRSKVLRNFTDAGNLCDHICKPSCQAVRYDVTLSKADWPNLNHQQFVINRSSAEWSTEILKLLEDIDDEDDLSKAFVTFRRNMLRVHVFVEEMIYLSIEESYSYTVAAKTTC